MTDRIENPPITGAAPLEPVISSELPENFIVYYSFNTKKSVTFSDTLSVMCRNELEGCGNVDLIKLEVHFKSTDVNQSLRAGVLSSMQSISDTQLAQKSNSISYTSNMVNTGVRHIQSIIPEDTLSRQIQPVSSHLPTLKFMLYADAGVEVGVNVYLKVHGVIQKWRVLN